MIQLYKTEGYQIEIETIIVHKRYWSELRDKVYRERFSKDWQEKK